MDITNLSAAFAEGYQLGRRAARQSLGTKIKVHYTPHVEELEFTRLDNGTIINYGRYLPF